MMKAVSANLAKEESDEGASPSVDVEKTTGGGGGDGGSFAKIAGANLGKIMYHKMMTTEPDQTPRNVRVATKLNTEQLNKHEQRRLLDPNFETNNPPPSAVHMATTSKINNTEDDEEGGHKGVVDRDTVKKLAKLVLGKDAAEKKKIALAAKRLQEKFEQED